MDSLAGKTLRHKNNFDVCFQIFGHLPEPIRSTQRFSGYWLNISDISGKEIIPIVHQAIEIKDVDMLNWFVYDQAKEAHRDSMYQRKVNKNVL